MKRKLVYFTLVIILVSITGCSKTNQSKNINEESDLGGITVTVTAKDSEVESSGAESSEAEDSGTTKDTKETQETEVTPSTTEETVSVSETPLTEAGIKDVYEQNGIKAGTCLSDTMITQSKYTDLITKNFSSITLENFMKPDYVLNKAKSIESGELTVEFTKQTTDLLDWAKSNGMFVRGHVLVWYSQTPDWIFYEGFDATKGLVDRDTMLARMESYIKQVFEKLDALGYADLFYAYDVVNEAIMEEGSYRDCKWKSIIGDDYIWYAFSYADQYAPESIMLYYNDYNEQFKTKAIVKLAESLVDVDGRSLIDGIGCQGHLYTGDSIDSYMTTLKAFSKLGLDVQITELDVSLGTWQKIEDATEAMLKTQGQYYYKLVNSIITENASGTTNVSAITFWGFADTLSWRNDRSPLLFDSSLKQKYAYYGAIQDYDNAGY